MLEIVFHLLGGIGLFLLGMTLLTDGLKAFAGDRLRRALVRFTGAPFKAFLSGALATVLVQSSSATTITVIGFVSAGLLTFPQALGVVLGASLGTTGTGWLVSVLGLKVSLGFYALPIVGAGAMIRLLAKGPLKSLGLAAAGFGLIFIGIETLQTGMLGLSKSVNLAALPSGGVLGHLAAVAVGVVMTVLMQSSSAAVATTLTALHTSAINFEQAATLVIGASIGTTVTGALAAIGGTVPAKRTALAHVLFNLGTGMLALAVLPLFLKGIEAAQRADWLEPGATSLAAFHTGFIGLGVALALPWVGRLAGRIERLIPDSDEPLTRHLDASLLQTPSVALEATRRSLCETTLAAIRAIREGLSGRPLAKDDPAVLEIRRAVDRAQDFLGKIPSEIGDEALGRARVDLMHAIDHIARLGSRLSPPVGASRPLAGEALRPALDSTRSILALGESALGEPPPEGWRGELDGMVESLSEWRVRERPRILRRAAERGERPELALATLDAIRWLERVGHHVGRACHYLAEARNSHSHSNSNSDSDSGSEASASSSSSAVEAETAAVAGAGAGAGVDSGGGAGGEGGAPAERVGD